MNLSIPSFTALSVVLAVVATSTLTTALNNGLGLRPALGWSSWYASPSGSQVTSDFVRNITRVMIDRGLVDAGFHYINIDEGFLQGRWANGTIYEDRKKFPEGMKALGEWIHAQDPRLKYGLYSCRGTMQCGTGEYSAPGSYGFEKEDTDWMVNYAGADWIKIDSCSASQVHSVAFSEYALFRNALNATGKEVFFNLCGWNPWYAPPDPSINYTGGISLGNSWRVDGDGADYTAITNNINTMATLYMYTQPGGFNDPDNIIGSQAPSFRITDTQAETQMILWSIFPAQLILGEDLTQMTDAYLEAATNEEMLAINQDFPFVGAGQRIQGSELTWPCDGGNSLPVGAVASVQAMTCGTAENANSQWWIFNSTDNTLRLAAPPSSEDVEWQERKGDEEMMMMKKKKEWSSGVAKEAFASSTTSPPPPLAVGTALTVNACQSADGSIVYLFPAGSNATGGCGNTNQEWIYQFANGGGNQSIVNPATGKCLDEYEWTTPRVDLWTCLPGATNEEWTFSGSTNTSTFIPGTLKNQDSGLCLTAIAPGDTDICTNIWSRPLSDGTVALGMINNGANSTSVTCDASCFAAANITSTSVRIRDVMNRVDIGVFTAPLNFTTQVGGGGSGALFKVFPQ